MITMARLHENSAIQRNKEQDYNSPSTSTSASQDPRMASHQQRSFVPNSSFQFDFRLEGDGLVTGKPNRGENFFSLPGFSDETDSSNTNSYACHQPYEPTPLHIPSHTHLAEPSPSPYIPSAASDLSSQTFPPFPPSSGSLSPREPASWTDDSSPSAPDLPFDGQLSHMSFPMGLHSPGQSLNLVSSARPRSTSDTLPKNVHQSPNATLSTNNPDLPQVKLGPNGLAEDQPPTAQGKMRTRVYVACLQCRSRKIRCDGAKPKCQKCTRRSSECDYDAAPKRRGPDKKPGARQRTSKKAKAAKEEAAGSEDPFTVAGILVQGVRESAGTDPGDGEVNKKRRRASGGDNSARTQLWSADTEDLESHRGSTATSCSVEGPTPLTPSDVPGISMTLSPIQDLPILSTDPLQLEGGNLNILHRYDKPIHTSTSHNRIAFPFSPNLPAGNERFRNMPVSLPQHPFYADPVDDLGFRYFPSAHISAVDEHDEDRRRQVNPKRKWEHVDIGTEPSLDFNRKTWWDSLLATYAPGSDRATAARQVHADLQFLFKSSNYFVSFFNVPLFFGIFCNPVERDRMQPSLVLAGLAISTFMKSSEINRGSAGRLRAMWLRDVAQSALEASFNAQWIEPTLAQAAWLLALFEMCAHPYHSSERCSSSLVMLDSIIRTLSLTTIDIEEPTVSVFSHRAVPAVPVDFSARVSRQEGCSCRSLTLGHNSRSSHEHTPMWAATAAWDPDWTVAEIKKEESRRLCWSTLQLAAGHTAHAAAFSTAPLDYFCIQPANYALLFPGEALLKTPSFTAAHSPKESVWALYSRAMLLWNSCLRMRGDNVSDSEKTSFAVNAWIESTAIEEALDAHTCGCDQAFLFQGREYLFITRMCISNEFRRFIPHPESEVSGLFNRKKAEAWLLHQATVAKRVMHGLHTVTGHKNNVLAQRPFFVWWFMGQVARSLSLWQCDNSLLIALEVCQAYFPPIDYLSCLWPCPTQRSRYLNLHARLLEACRTAGLPPPPAPNFDLLAPGSPPVSVI